MKKIKIVSIILLCIMLGLSVVSNAEEVTGVENGEVIEPVQEGTYAILNDNSIELYENETYELKLDTDYLGEIKWESSNEEIVSVENGIITAIQSGETVITVRCGEFVDTCDVVVKEVKLTLNSNKTVAIYKNGRNQIKANYSLGNENIKYSSSNQSIAKVSTTGQITGVAPGKAVITISAGNCENKYVTVYVVNKTLSTPVVKISRTSNSFNITWNKITGASKYVVYRKIDSGSWTKITTTTGTKYVEKNLAYGKKYYYKVQAVGSAYGLERASAYSSYVRGLTNTIYRPDNVKVTSANYNKITITWTKVVPARGYEIYRATSKNGTYKKIATISNASTVTYTDSKLTTGKTYYYKIRAVYGTAKSPYTTVKSVAPIPRTPVIKTIANVTNKTVKISWEAVSGASGYVVYRRASTNNSWEKIATVKGGNTLTYTDKTSGAWYYCVKAYRTVNGKKIYGNRSEAIRVCALNKTTVTAVQDGEKIAQVVSWNKVKNATAYQVYRKIGKNGTWERVKNTTAIVHKENVRHGVVIYWKVRPIYQNNGVTSYGAFSAEVNCIASYEPNYSVYMSDEYDPVAYSIGMIFTNNGTGTVRIYSDDAYYYDAGYSSFTRYLYMIETETGYFYPIDYIDVKPGESKIVMFSVYNNDYTWYDSTGRLYFKFRYDGVTYTGCSSADYGNIYWEN